MNLPTVLRLILAAALPIMLSGCMVIAVADAAITVVATTVRAGWLLRVQRLMLRQQG